MPRQDILAGLNAARTTTWPGPWTCRAVRPALAGRRVLKSQAQLIRMREDLTRQALYDPLTQTLNRRGGFMAIGRGMNRAARMQTSVAVVLCDLDHFKVVNDTFGHPAGDSGAAGGLHTDGGRDYGPTTSSAATAARSS